MYLDVLVILYEIDVMMVWGLDYYNYMIFEIMIYLKVLGKGYMMICVGGCYNGLVKELGGFEVLGVGFGLGVEWLLVLMDVENIVVLIDD